MGTRGSLLSKKSGDSLEGGWRRRCGMGWGEDRGRTNGLPLRNHCNGIGGYTLQISLVMQCHTGEVFIEDGGAIYWGSIFRNKGGGRLDGGWRGKG